MDQTLFHDGGQPAMPVVTDTRLDKRKREIVDAGVVMQQNGNTVAAFEFLKGRHVEHHVIQRVLLDPGRRRSLG